MKSVNYLHEFLEAEDNNDKTTSRQLKREFESYESSFNLLLETLHYLYDCTMIKQVYLTSEFATLIIAPRIVQSMQSIRALSLKGYYYEASILERCLLESLGLCVYFASNEEEAKNWLKGKDIKLAKYRLVKNILSIFKIKNESVKSIFGKYAESAYGKLSGYVHTQMKAVISLVVDYDSETPMLSIQPTPEYDKKKVPEIAYYPMLMLVILMKIFPMELAEKEEEIMNFIIQNVPEERSNS